MYYQNYEDYMRSVLGYPVNSPNIYEDYEYREAPNMIGYDSTYQNVNTIQNTTGMDIRNLYPDIYHLVSPMVNKICEANTEPITKELIERMTDEIYMAIEGNSDIIVNVRAEAKKEPEISNNTRKIENRCERNSQRHESRNEVINRRLETRSENIANKNESRNKQEDSTRASSSSKEIKEVREVTENRQRNYLLRDLIKILILNQIFGGRPDRPRPPRPPFPGGPGTPPRPPMGPGRPPIQPRDYSGYLKF